MTQLEALKLWVKALRSGDYIQGKGYLHMEDRFCCLGVACDLFKEQLGLTVRDNLEDEPVVVTYDGEDGTLPEAVSTLTGVDRLGSLRSEVMVSGTAIYTFIELNDTAEFTFDQIADVIEEQFIKPLLEGEK